MNADWKTIARQLGHFVQEDEIVLQLSTGRQQRVFVDENGVAVRIWSVILGPAGTSELQDGHPLEYAWERNRLSDLVGFSLDSRSRLVGESWIPRGGMNRALFELHLAELARVCDWHELRLSGDDRY